MHMLFLVTVREICHYLNSRWSDSDHYMTWTFDVLQLGRMEFGLRSFTLKYLDMLKIRIFCCTLMSGFCYVTEHEGDSLVPSFSHSYSQ
jgi:hypothetical protein